MGHANLLASKRFVAIGPLQHTSRIIRAMQHRRVGSVGYRSCFLTRDAQ